MWKKSEPDRSERRPSMGVVRIPEEHQPGKGAAAAPSASGGPMTAEHAGERAVIGASITIKGDVTGDEDLVIQGRVEGKVDLAQHNVTVGANGRIKANVIGRSVTVEGQVEGDMRAEEQIAIRKTAKVKGNVSAPRVTIEDGATFQGSIDMERKEPSGARAPQPTAGAGAHPPGSGVPASVATRPGETRHPERTG